MHKHKTITFAIRIETLLYWRPSTDLANSKVVANYTHDNIAVEQLYDLSNVRKSWVHNTGMQIAIGFYVLMIWYNWYCYMGLLIYLQFAYLCVGFCLGNFFSLFHMCNDSRKTNTSFCCFLFGLCYCMWISSFTNFKKKNEKGRCGLFFFFWDIVKLILL